MSHVEDIPRLAADARTRIQEISPDEARGRVASGSVLIDVREEKEFKAGNIPGSILISRGVLASCIRDVVPDPETPIVVYCAIGHRSAIAADTLQTLGYRNVVSMAGGLKAYLVNASDRKSA